jgi:hypothetical protein
LGWGRRTCQATSATKWAPIPACSGIKTRSSPAAFPTTLSLQFPPLHSPHTAPVVPKASASSTFPCMPPPSTERYDAACEKNALARPPALICSTPPQYSLIGRPTVGPTQTMTLRKAWISRSPATRSPDGLRYRTSVTLLKTS